MESHQHFTKYDCLAKNLGDIKIIHKFVLNSLIQAFLIITLFAVNRDNVNYTVNNDVELRFKCCDVLLFMSVKEDRNTLTNSPNLLYTEVNCRKKIQ